MDHTMEKEHLATGGTIKEAGANEGLPEVEKKQGTSAADLASRNSLPETSEVALGGDSKPEPSLAMHPAYQRPFNKRVPFSDQNPPLPLQIPEDLIPPNAVDISPRLNQKLWKVVLDTGDESQTLFPRRGNLAVLHYKTWYANDPSKKIFDSSSLFSDDTEPITVNIGERQVIGAIDLGLQTMTKRGEKAVFIAHYDLGYGRYSSRHDATAGIPDGSFVCVEVELVDIQDGAGPSNSHGETVVQKIIRLADNDSEEARLTSNSIMFIKLEGFKLTRDQEEERFLEETVLPFTPAFNTWGFFSSGETQYPIPYSLGPLMRCLKAEDKVEYQLFGESAFPEDLEVNGVAVKKEEPVKFVVEVDSVEQLYDPFLLSLKEKVELCDKLLNSGVFYAAQNWNEAAACKFTRVREYLWEATLHLKQVPEDLGKMVDDQLYFALCQLATLYWKLPEMTEKEALKHCNDAVALMEGMVAKYGKDLEYWKVMEGYRVRGRLYLEVLKDYEKAGKDFRQVVQILEKGILEGKGLFDEMADLRVTDAGDIQEEELKKKKKIDKLKQLNAEVLVQLQEAEDLAKKEKKKPSFVLKYVPPK